MADSAAWLSDALLLAIFEHQEQPRFQYVHHWRVGDLIMWDNRCTVHAATWFDAAHEARIMWRTTVSGNPGPLYAGEPRSWIPA